MKLATSIAVAAVLSAGLPGQGRPVPGITKDWSVVEARVAWHGTWRGAEAAAKATGRPILLVSAAPHCGLVPGMW